jgi:hypothetical protein
MKHRKGRALKKHYGHAGPKTYRGWLIEPYEGTHIGYKLPDSRSISAQIGAHTHRNTMREAKEYIDNYLGVS